MIAATKGAT